MLLDEEDPGEKSSLISTPYYLILDTNIILDQVSIFKSYIFLYISCKKIKI